MSAPVSSSPRPLVFADLFGSPWDMLSTRLGASCRIAALPCFIVLVGLLWPATELLSLARVGGPLEKQDEQRIEEAGAEKPPIGRLRALRTAVSIPFGLIAVPMGLVLLCVAIHGSLKFAPTGPLGWGHRWSRHHWRYLAWYLPLAISPIAVLLVAQGAFVVLAAAAEWARQDGLLETIWVVLVVIVWLMHPVSLVLVAYGLARSALVFPAIAAGRPIGLRGSWRLTRGHGWRILFAVVTWELVIHSVIGLVFGLVALVLFIPILGELNEAKNGAPDSGTGLGWFGDALTFGWAFCIAIWLVLSHGAGAAILSEAYRRLAPEVGGDARA